MVVHKLAPAMGISSFCVLGERVSGTCVLVSLIARNIAGLNRVAFKHKHFFQDMDQIRRSNTSSTLFVYVTREPVAWVHSMCKTPYHTHLSLKNKGVSAFMRKEWYCVEDEASGVSQDSKLYGKEMLHERDPGTGERFRNVFKMRSAKIAHTLALGEMVENFVHVRLDDLQADPEGFIASICHKYSLRKNKEFSAVTTVRGKGKVVYKPTIYPSLSEDDTEYLLGELDLEAEAVLGYC